MKRLFEVTVEKTLYVLADDELEAEVEAKSVEADEDPWNVMAHEITDPVQIPNECMHTLPYGDNEGKELTLAQLMELPPPPPRPYNDPNQLKLGFPGC